MNIVMKCSVCGNLVEEYVTQTVLKIYNINYYRCTNCSFIEAQKPRYWLKKAYKQAIISADTGLLSRNITLSKMTAILLLLTGKKDSQVLDYAGGYGVMTRLLRDIGLDCYWQDRYAKNIFVRGFESKEKHYDVVCSFELFEHLDNPLKEIGDILNIYSPDMLIFSTTLHDGDPGKDWWYFVPEGGQHISFYTRKSLQIIADKLGYHLTTNGSFYHIFSKIYISSSINIIFSKLWMVLSIILPIFYKSKTFSDHLSYSQKK